MKKRNLFLNLLFIIFLSYFFISCSEEDNTTINGELQVKSTSECTHKPEFITLDKFIEINKEFGIELDESELPNIKTLVAMYGVDNSIESLEELGINILKYHYIPKQKNKLKSQEIPPGAIIYFPIYCETEKTGYHELTRTKKNDMAMLSNSVAKHIGVSSGYYIVDCYKATYTFKTTESTFDFFMLDALNCGFKNSQSGVISFLSRGYGIQLLNEKNDVLLITNLIHVISNRNGSRIDKWLPCSPEEIKWNYGYFWIPANYR